MNAEQIILIQQTYEPFLIDPVGAAARFYAQLFALDPTLRRLFQSNMDAQHNKLSQILSAAVTGLWDLDALTPVLLELGRRHARYGVQPPHYATVGTALLETLRIANGSAWTADVDQAWRNAYSWISSTMLSATRA